MNRLAPSFMASLIMGAWFYMTAVGNFVAGKIGEATGGDGGEMSKERRWRSTSMIGWITIGVGVVVLLLSPFVKRWMHLDTLQDRDALAGRDELAEPQAPGMHPERETEPRRPRRLMRRRGACARLLRRCGGRERLRALTRQAEAGGADRGSTRIPIRRPIAAIRARRR